MPFANCILTGMFNYTVLIKIVKLYQTINFFMETICCVILISSEYIAVQQLKATQKAHFPSSSRF